MTYQFKINPKARWADNLPVTADDVIATWDLLMDPGLLQPLHQVVGASSSGPGPWRRTWSRCAPRRSTGGTS